MYTYAKGCLGRKIWRKFSFPSLLSFIGLGGGWKDFSVRKRVSGSLWTGRGSSLLENVISSLARSCRMEGYRTRKNTPDEGWECQEEREFREEFYYVLFSAFYSSEHNAGCKDTSYRYIHIYIQCIPISDCIYVYVMPIRRSFIFLDNSALTCRLLHVALSMNNIARLLSSWQIIMSGSLCVCMKIWESIKKWAKEKRARVSGDWWNPRSAVTIIKNL